MIVEFLKFNLRRTGITSEQELPRRDPSIHLIYLVQCNVWDGHTKEENQQGKTANAYTCIPLLTSPPH